MTLQQAMNSAEPIVCAVTGWFYRRTLLPGLVCLAVAGWFFFDGSVVYPVKLRIYQEYRAYKAQRDLLLRDSSDPLRIRAEKEWEALVKLYPSFKKDMRWKDLAERYGWPQTNVPDWPDYAKSKGYAERMTEKDRVTRVKITGQVVSGFIFLTAASLFLGNALFESRKSLKADHLAIEFPNGQRVPFDRILRVDKRKWNDQGLALIEWKKADGHSEVSKLDCLKFDEAGAEKIMQRIVAQPGVEVLSGGA